MTRRYRVRMRKPGGRIAYFALTAPNDTQARTKASVLTQKRRGLLMDVREQKPKRTPIEAIDAGLTDLLTQMRVLVDRKAALLKPTPEDAEDEANLGFDDSIRAIQDEEADHGQL